MAVESSAAQQQQQQQKNNNNKTYSVDKSRCKPQQFSRRTIPRRTRVGKQCVRISTSYLVKSWVQFFVQKPALMNEDFFVVFQGKNKNRF
jgi:hypothetical protein